jgi:hypothetical protein
MLASPCSDTSVKTLGEKGKGEKGEEVKKKSSSLSFPFAHFAVSPFSLAF